MISDDFPAAYTRWKGTTYRCIEHARWALVFAHLGFQAQYQPRRMKFERPANERYKKGSKTEYWYFDLHFFLPCIGTWVCCKRETGPTVQTYLDAQRTAQETGYPVAILHGGPIVPTPHGFNHITYVQGVEDEIRGTSFVDRRGKIAIERPECWSDRFTDRLQMAFVLAELLSPEPTKVELGTIPSEQPNGKTNVQHKPLRKRNGRRAVIGGARQLSSQQSAIAIKDVYRKSGKHQFFRAIDKHKGKLGPAITELLSQNERC